MEKETVGPGRQVMYVGTGRTVVYCRPGVPFPGPEEVGCFLVPETL